MPGAARAPDRDERAPADRAHQARTVADNLARWAAAHDDAHRDLETARTAEDHAAASHRAAQALGALRDLAADAPTFAADAPDPATREALGRADALIRSAEARAMPEPPAATGTAASPGHAAFVDALPPAEAPRRQEAPALLARLTQVIESRLTFGDLDALVRALGDDAPTRARFERLSERAREQLLARLTSRSLRQRLIATHNARCPASSPPRVPAGSPDGPDPTREVAARFGAQLGVTPQLTTGEGARAATEAHGAAGLAHDDRIAIHPDVDPDSAEGRRVIAHELVHQAQAQLPAADDRDRGDAEVEADALAATAAAGGAMRAPTHAIDLSRPARNNDATPAGAGPDSAAGDHARELTRARGASYAVFAATGKPYLIEGRGSTPGAWVVRDWVREHGTYQDGSWLAPACARELLTAMGWVDPARIEFAASALTFRFSRAVDYLAIGAEASHGTGLQPGAKAIVERASDQALALTVALDEPNTPPGTPHDLTASEMIRAIDAAAAFTQLTPTVDGLTFVMAKAAREPVVTGNGTFYFTMNRGFCRTLFGFEDFEQWWTGKVAAQQPPPSDTPRLALVNFYQRPIPGELTHYAGILESGERARFEVLVAWPPDAPDPEVYAAPPMAVPSKFGPVAVMRCAWRFERVSPGPAAGGASATGGAPASKPGFLRDLLDQAFAPATAAAPPPDPVPTSPDAAAPAPPAKAGNGALTTTELAETFHVFKLAPGETEAVWRVTCEASCDAYFTPATFALDVTVRESKAAMAGLRQEAFTGLGASDDHRGASQWTVALAADHVATPVAPAGGSIFTDALTPDPASAHRRVQREQLQNVRAYLATADEQNPGADHNTETIEAIDRELARQWKTEAALASDRQSGAQPFDVRGTYLSRTEGVASGPLELHGTVRTSVGASRQTDVDVTIIDTYVVQLRDLSRRFEQEDFLFVGEGRSFDLALEDAFNRLATAYPRGLVSIEAEQLRGEALRRLDGSPGAPGPLGTGKAIGFQRSSETTWKEVKGVVWDPIASAVVNLGAMAIMAVAPFTAPVIAPALVVYNAVPVVDHLATHANRGTLTARELVLSVGELALNVLPIVGTARPLGAGWYAIEAANWGGQALILHERVRDRARQLQTEQVSALARQYQQLLDLKKHHSADNAATARAEALLEDQVRQVNHAIHDAFTELAGQNLLFAVAATTIHSTLPGARAALLAALERRGAALAAAGDPPPGGPGKPPVPAGDPPIGAPSKPPIPAVDPSIGADTPSRPGRAPADPESRVDDTTAGAARDAVLPLAPLEHGPTITTPRGSAEVLPPNRYRPAPEAEQDLDGSAEKELLIDTQTGKKYLFKPSRPDAAIPVRAGQNGITPETLAARAKASQITADALGIDTPNVRLVVFDGQYGSLQDWRQQAETISLADLERKDPKRLRFVMESEEYTKFRSGLDTLDFIINNLDRNPGNILIHFGKNKALIGFTAIDHDHTFTKSAARFKDPLGTWARPLPAAYDSTVVARLRALASKPGDLRKKLRPFLDEVEIDGAIARLNETLADAERIPR